MIILFAALEGYIHILNIHIVDTEFDLSVFTMITLDRGNTFLKNKFLLIHKWVIVDYKFKYRRLIVVFFTVVYFYYVQNDYVYIKYTEKINYDYL